VGGQGIGHAGERIVELERKIALPPPICAQVRDALYAAWRSPGAHRSASLWLTRVTP